MEEDISRLSDAQRNVLIAISIGDKDSKYFIPSTVVSLCRLGLATLLAYGELQLTARGKAAAYKLDHDGSIAAAFA